MKIFLQLFGMLDIVTLVRSYQYIIPPTTAWSVFPVLTLSKTLLYTSLIFSAYFLLKQSKPGFWLTYGQFPLRLAFVILSFGFLFTVNRLFSSNAYSYIILFWILIVLEISRLILTMLIHRKYLSVLKTVN